MAFIGKSFWSGKLYVKMTLDEYDEMRSELEKDDGVKKPVYGRSIATLMQ